MKFFFIFFDKVRYKRHDRRKIGINYQTMNKLKIISVFIIYASFFLSSSEKRELSWLYAMDKKIKPTSFSLEKRKEKGVIGECFLMSNQGISSEGFPRHLLHYVLYRLEFIQDCQIVNKVEKVMSFSHLKNIAKKSKDFLSLPSSLFIKALPLDFDFDIKYKGIKRTKDERPPLPLNYLAREFEIAKGFEAGETLLSCFNITPHWKIISRLGLFEKWIAERVNYEASHHMEIEQEEIEEYTTQLTGTLKYAIGCGWGFIMKDERKVNIEFLMQQQTHNQWKVKQFMLSERSVSGIIFDHWVLTITLDF